VHRFKGRGPDGTLRYEERRADGIVRQKKAVVEVTKGTEQGKWNRKGGGCVGDTGDRQEGEGTKASYLESPYEKPIGARLVTENNARGTDSGKNRDRRVQLPNL